MFRIRSLFTNACLAGFDVAVSSTCYFALLAIRLPSGSHAGSLDRLLTARNNVGLGFFLVVWIGLSLYLGLYRSRRLESVFGDLSTLFKVGLVSWVVLKVCSLGLPGLEHGHDFFLRFALANTLLLSLTRTLLRVTLRKLRRRGWNVKNLVLISRPELRRGLAEKFELRSSYGYRVVRDLVYSPEAEQASRLLAELHACLHGQRVDDVILALPSQANELAAQLILECEKHGAAVRLVPDLFPLVRSETQVYDLGGIPLVNVRLYPTEYFRYAVVKRCFDVVVSALVLVFLSPLYLAIAALIKLTSPGPVFFAQGRVGLNGKKFKMLKFRTMTHGGGLNSDSHWTVPGDPHVTRVGRWLRRSNLDELPQFLNVLLGHMSIVGPRPERPFFLDRFRREVPEYMARHYVKSGITGWAQVNGWRGDTSIPARVAHDLYYIRNWAMGLDLKILFLTLTRTFFHRNAY